MDIISGISIKAGRRLTKAPALEKRLIIVLGKLSVALPYTDMLMVRVGDGPCSGLTRAQGFSKVVLHILGFESVLFIYFYVE